ncbi:MAG: tRNA guanosine(15) transglycosylase TgtA [Ignisphaera sp.]|nr:tRNA guanosine(15) transglycosylase TgtA [Ignisphaera sp.]
MREIDLAGRIGRLLTRHGFIETPYIFPVVDPILREQYLPINEILNAGFNGIMTNAYILKKHRGAVADIHDHLGFSGVVVTDSGAYQILRYGDVEVSNREIVQYQCEIKSDIGVILDIPTSSDVDRDAALKSADETYRRAVEVLDIVERCGDTLWTLPIQGGTHLDILRQYAERSVEVFYRGYSIYALGSPTTLLEQYDFDRIIDMIFAVRSIIPFSTPLHLFGAGHPLIVPFAAALGVDTMDSASYILYAKDDRYMGSRATYRLEDLSYFPCTCPVCSKYSPEDVRRMPKRKRVELLALHNLHALSREFREVKQAIKEGRLWEYLEDRANSHPATRRAFEQLKRYLEFIYRHTPIVKPDARAVFILSEDSIFNPKIMIPRRRVLERFDSEVECIDLIPYRRGEGFPDSGIGESKCASYIYFPILGIAPLHLVDRYPYSQFEFGFKVTDKIVSDLSHLIFEALLKMLKISRTIVVNIYVCSNVEWQKELYRKLINLAQQVGESSVKIVLKAAKCRLSAPG